MLFLCVCVSVCVCTRTCVHACTLGLSHVFLTLKEFLSSLLFISCPWSYDNSEPSTHTLKIRTKLNSNTIFWSVSFSLERTEISRHNRRACQYSERLKTSKNVFDTVAVGLTFRYWHLILKSKPNHLMELPSSTTQEKFIGIRLNEKWIARGETGWEAFKNKERTWWSTTFFSFRVYHTTSYN